MPSINFSKHISEDIFELVSPLINSNKLVDISKDILLMNEFGVLSKAFNNDMVSRSFPFMANFCEETINMLTQKNKFSFLNTN